MGDWETWIKKNNARIESHERSRAANDEYLRQQGRDEILAKIRVIIDNPVLGYPGINHNIRKLVNDYTD